MFERATSNALWARALRIVLVFTLVFWSTFHVEALAFAALVGDDAAAHEPGTLSDLDVWQVDQGDSARVASFVVDALTTATGGSQAFEPALVADGQTAQFVALPAWGDSTTADSAGAEVRIADFVEWSVSDPSLASVQANGGVATLTALASGTVTLTCKLAPSASQLASASFPGAFEASFRVQIAEPAQPEPEVHVTPPYVSSIELHKPDGSVCYDNEEITLSDAERASYSFSVKVNVFDEAADEARSYECAAGQSLSVVSGGQFGDLVWDVQGADGAAVGDSVATVEDGVVKLTGDGPVVVRCVSPNGLNDIPLSTQVVVKSTHAKPVDPADPATLQGDDHRQNSLTVTINAPVAADDASGDGSSGGAENGRENAGDTGDTGNAGQPGSGEDAGEGPSSQADGDVSQSPDRASESGASGQAVESGTATYTLAQLEEALDFGMETYTMRDADGFAIVTGQGPSFAALLDFAGIPLDQQANIESIDFVTSGGNPATVSVSWADLVAANIFYPHAASDDLSEPARSVVMLAVKSYVHAPTEAADAPISADKLVENTRFRLLYGAGSGASISNPDALRYISGIVVNMEGAEKPDRKPEVDPGDDPQVFVDYVPVPRGETAILSPRYYLPPSISGGSVQFSYTWEMSADGEAWEVVRDSAGSSGENAAASGQALHVLTDDGTIGTYRRFVLNITQYNGATGEEVQSAITSSPVRIRAAGEKTEGEEDGEDPDFIVALDYIPPIAGDVANFTAKMTLVDSSIDESQIDYEWQMSVDGGLNWTGRDSVDCPDLLKQQSGVMCTTLRIPTQPVSDNASADSSGDGQDEGANQLIYIRVVAHYAGHKSVASNAQPLTVHVGESESTGEKADDIEDALNGRPSSSDQTDPSDNAEPSEPSESTSPREPSESTRPSEPSEAPAQPEPAAPSESADPSEPSEAPVQPEPRPQATAGQKPQAHVTEIDSIVFEEAVPPSSSQPVTSDPTHIYVNDAVSEAVMEQREAAEEAAASTPGYRWTQLSTVDPTGDDVRNILGVNPFAPFAAPLALGLTAAGAVEKLIGFRRQTK